MVRRIYVFKTCGNRRMKKLQDEEIQNVYSMIISLKATKFRLMRWAKCETRTVKYRNTYKTSAANLKGKHQVGDLGVNITITERSLLSNLLTSRIFNSCTHFCCI